MGWVKQTLGASVGGKFIVAVSGLAMAGFLIAHLSGNLLFFKGPEAMAAYAEGLRHYLAVLWALRLGLIAATFFHVTVAIKLNLDSKKARPVPYARKSYLKASLQSRTMVLTGLLTLFYILFHLAHFTWRATSPEIAALGPWDCYQMLVLAFSNPLMSFLYIAAMVVLGVHLAHGISSLFQTLGIRQGKYDKLLGAVGPLFGAAVALGFISIPVSVLTGLMK
jgi:succinate dehydrogenase / fumarate reductase cytochrome b subunit